MAKHGVLRMLPQLLLLVWLQGCGGSGKGDQAGAVYIRRRADQCSDMPACTASSAVTSCPASFGSGAGDDWDSMGPVYTGSGPYQARYGHGVVDFFGMILIIGGLKVSSADSAEREGLSDVWTLSLSTADSTAATQRIQDDAGFLGRGLFSSVAHVDGSAAARVYIFGGMTGASTTASDAWRSDGSGVTWENVASPSTTPRVNSVLLSSAGRLFLIGGGDSDCDVKVSSNSDPISWATAELPTGTTALCGPSAGIVSGTRIIVYSFRSNRIYAQILQWSEATTSLSVLKSRWELTTEGGSTLVFSGVGTAVLVGGTPYIVGSSSSTGRQRIFHAAEGGLDTASAWTEKGANSCSSGAWCDTSTGTAAVYSNGLLCLSGGLKSDPQRRSLRHEVGHDQQVERRAASGSSGVWCSGAQFDAPAVTFQERNVVMTRCGGDFFTPLNAAGFYMLCPEGQGGGSWSVISSIGTVPIGNSKVTVYAKTQHTATDWSTVSPSPTSCGVIEALASPPTPAPSPTPSPTPPSTPPPTPAPTPAPSPPPRVNGIDPCCNSACDFSACQPNGVVDATGGSMIIVYGYSLWDATSITVGGRECIPAASASTLGCGPTSNYGGLADSQCQCISPPGSGAMQVEVRGGSGGAAWSSVKDVVYGQVYATSFGLGQQSSRPSAGGGGFSVLGSGFGRSGALGKSLYASVADDAGFWADFEGPAGRVSSRVEWVSETSIKGIVPAGVGSGVTVSLRLEKSGWIYTVPNSPTSLVFSYSYDPPSVTSIIPATSYQGLTITLVGRNFGAGEYSLGIYAVSVGGLSCSSVTWVSDSSLLCDLPASGSGSNHSVEVAVAGQRASLPALFSYTGASKEYRFGTGASASDARSNLRAWSNWLAGLISVSEEQVYAKVIEGVGGRRQTAGSIISVKFLGTRQEQNSFAAAELALSTLVSDGKLSGSPVPLTYIQAGNIKTSISQTPSPSTSVSGSPSPSGPSSSLGSSNTPGQPSIFIPVQSSDSISNVGLGAGVGCAVLAVVAAGYLLRRRLHKRSSSEAGTASGQGVPEPSAPSLPGTGSYVNGTFSYLSRPNGPGEVDSIGQHRARRRQGNLCDQCRRSGFAVCIHGLVEPHSIEVVSDSQVPSLVRGDLGAEARLPPHDEDEDDENLCVVCLDAPREAVVVHNDAEYTTHQVLCLDCAARIAGSGGACPMCRAPIFAILQARDSAHVPPSLQRD